MRKIVAFLFFAALLHPVLAQEDFYRPGAIREIRIRFAEPGWRQILDSLFETVGDDGKLVGDVTIDGCLYRKAGIRYKGYSSYNADEIKNPFNIDLDYHIKNQNHLGHVKLKLSNVIHDPSFIREVLSYEIARKYLPSCRANFANLYVNDTLIGLYTNVEAVDRFFVKEHYGSNDHSFFKGEPAKLEYPFGQNANLALTHGTDSTGYMPYYNMESDYGWSDLYDLIGKLDRGAASADSVLNTDRALWMHAFNEVLVNLDSYIGYSQNYYMYQDDHARFNPILWDMNMSFGSFRETDGAKHFLGLTIAQTKTLDPLALLTFSVSPRPLMTRLLANDTLRKMYLAHMRTIADENFRNGWYYSRAAELRAGIDSAVLADTNRFYSYADFQANLDTTVGGTGGMKQYIGIKELMSARLKYLDGLDGFSGQPVIGDPVASPAVPRLGDSVRIAARIDGGTLALLGYRCSTDERFRQVPMHDDGLYSDSLAGDGIFTATIRVTGALVRYYLYAQNDSAGTFSPPRAEYEYHTLQPAIAGGAVVVNELLGGDLTDYRIELLNTTREPLRTGGMKLSGQGTDNPCFDLPDTVIPGKFFYLIYPVTLNGCTSLTGQTLHLYNARGDLIDTFACGTPTGGKSLGRYPNGYGPMTFMTPTPGSNNFPGSTPAAGLLVYPNPARDSFTLEFEAPPGDLTLTLFNSRGERVVEQNLLTTGASGNLPESLTVDASGLSRGLYLVKISGNNSTFSEKIILQ
ncbi:MAG TPA: CotH kinase family protein [Bacteroidales bacterium]|nr:CotH kinase family protein [Bacteroidales bacterium]